MGIFSAKYRKLALEAFDCVARKTTFRPCRTNFDEKMKAKIIGKLMAKNEKVAGIVFKHFELMSWIFTLMMIASILMSAYGVYNWIAFGNCNGPNSTENCYLNDLTGLTTTVDGNNCPVDANQTSASYISAIDENQI